MVRGLAGSLVGPPGKLSCANGCKTTTEGVKRMELPTKGGHSVKDHLLTIRTLLGCRNPASNEGVVDCRSPRWCTKMLASGEAASSPLAQPTHPPIDRTLLQN